MIFLLSLFFLSFNCSYGIEDKSIEELEEMLDNFRDENAALVEKLEEKIKAGSAITASDIMELTGNVTPNLKNNTFEEMARLSLKPIAILSHSQIKEHFGDLIKSLPIGNLHIFGERTLNFLVTFVTHPTAPYKIASLLDNTNTLKLFLILNIVIFVVYFFWKMFKRKRLGRPLSFSYRFKLYLLVTALRFGIFYMMIFPYLRETWEIFWVNVVRA